MSPRRIGALVAIVLALGAGASLAWRGRRAGPPVLPDGVSIWGVDVSHHQGAVDWRTVAAQPRLRFAYIKATEGGDWRDPRFHENWEGARSAGLEVGAYHYFTFCRPPVEQATLFLQVVPREADALPPALDLEVEGNCPRPPAQDVIATNVSIWVAEVERVLRRKPVVYLSRSAYESFVAGRALTNPVWIRSLAGTAPSRPRWRFWQFADDATVPGIQGDVDVDAFDGEAEALERL
jgi:lysozyme